MRMRKFILRCRLFLSRFHRQNVSQESGFIYEVEDEEFQTLTTEDQAKHLQRSWNRKMME